MRIFTNFEPSLPIQSYRGFWHQKSSVGQPFVTAATLKRIAFFTWKQSPTKWLTYFRIFFFCQKNFFFFFSIFFLRWWDPRCWCQRGLVQAFLYQSKAFLWHNLSEVNFQFADEKEYNEAAIFRPHWKRFFREKIMRRTFYFTLASSSRPNAFRRFPKSLRTQ